MITYHSKDDVFPDGIKWPGEIEPPVPIGTRISIEHRGCWCLTVLITNGSENWKHNDSDMDIVKYKILPPKEEKRELI